MKNLYEKLSYDLDALLKDAETEESTLLRLEISIVSVKEILDQLREFILKTGFRDKQEEVSFFKEVKLEFYSTFIYYVTLYKWELKRPPGNKVSVIDFYKGERGKIETFIHSNEGLYSYYRSGAKYLDNYYFTRHKFDPKSAIDDLDFDPEFSTGHDYKFSRIKAAEKLLIYLDELIHNETSPLQEMVISATDKITWTGDGINLIELAYGLWLTGQVNHGNASVSLIVRKLESFFGIHLGRAARRWEEIAARKKDSPTRFLDQMTLMVRQRLDDQLKL